MADKLHSSFQPCRIAVLISGGGSTMMNLHRHIEDGELSAKICLMIASRQCTGIEKGQAAGIPAMLLSPKKFASVTDYSDAVFEEIRNVNADVVLLAGFLSRIIIPHDFMNRVINIHPSLIPAFCGHGMYGHHVHEAVLNRGCKVSGCTVHFCDNEYDHGPIILQKVVSVMADDDADTLASRVQAAEREAFPEAVKLFVQGRLEIRGRMVHVLDKPSAAANS